MPEFINVGGTWREASKHWVNVGGTWREVKEKFVNVGGTWKSTWVGSLFSFTCGHKGTSNSNFYGWSKASGVEHGSNMIFNDPAYSGIRSFFYTSKSNHTVLQYHTPYPPIPNRTITVDVNGKSVTMPVDGWSTYREWRVGGDPFNFRGTQGQTLNVSIGW